MDSFGLKILSLQFMRRYGILFIAENQGEPMGGNFYFHNVQNAFLIDSAYQKIEKHDSVEMLN
jgi:hypothetical protein